MQTGEYGCNSGDYSVAIFFYIGMVVSTNIVTAHAFSGNSSDSSSRRPCRCDRHVATKQHSRALSLLLLLLPSTGNIFRSFSGEHKSKGVLSLQPSGS